MSQARQIRSAEVKHDGAVLGYAEGRPRIALAGNPNCGKTTAFNAWTGARQHVGNYPGVTVERRKVWRILVDRPCNWLISPAPIL